MAYSEFYMTPTGSDVNSGTSTANSAAVTDAGGTYTQGGGAGGGTSDKYAASAGTPFSGVSVGDWASIYTAGATVATYVVKITAVNAGGASIDVDSTKLFGTRAASASTKTCKVGGAWASLALCASGNALNTGTVTQATRINVLAGTYANTTTARTLGIAGTTVLPFLVEGYRTNPQDLETAPAAARVAATDIPNFTWTTSGFTAGNFQTYANLAFSDAFNGVAFACSTHTKLDRVQVTNTSTGGSAQAVSNATASRAMFFACRFTLAGTSAACVQGSSATGIIMYDCVIDGGNNGASMGNAVLNLQGCKFVNQTAACVLYTGGNVTADRCTFYGGGAAAVDGIKTSAPASSGASTVTNCIFDTLTNGVNNSSGTNTYHLHCRNNLFHSVTNTYVGLSERYATGDVTDSASPFTSTAGGDFTLLATSNGKAAGSPGMFEGEAFSSYLDIGAYQRQEAGPGAQHPFPGGTLMGL